MAAPSFPLLLSGLAGAAPAPAPGRVEGNGDFDGLVGEWTMHNRRLRKILAGSKDWYEFTSTCATRPIFGGRGQVDEYEADLPDGKAHISGLTVRMFEPPAKKWRLYWANANRGIFDDPVVGQFRDGVGEFIGPDSFEGKPILVRFRWTNVNRGTPHWEQAFSPDDGKTWETNWMNDLTPRHR